MLKSLRKTKKIFKMLKSECNVILGNWNKFESFIYILSFLIWPHQHSFWSDCTDFIYKLLFTIVLQKDEKIYETFHKVFIFWKWKHNLKTKAHSENESIFWKRKHILKTKSELDVENLPTAKKRLSMNINVCVQHRMK